MRNWWFYIHTLHEDAYAFKAWKQDILKELKNGCERYKIKYDRDSGNETPTDAKITKTAILDFDTSDYKILCPFCAIKAYRSEDYIEYTIG